MPDIKTVLFDLDGTLIDTAPDMANALNILLEEEGLAPLPYEDIRPVVSNGSVALVNLGFGQVDDDNRLNHLKQRYLDIYQQHLCEDSVLFNGMQALLDTIENRNMNWGVVTNKPGWLTMPLMEQIGLAERVIPHKIANHIQNPCSMPVWPLAVKQNNASMSVMHAGISKPVTTPA